jgi:Mrp family chromosome partitioning ATPase
LATLQGQPNNPAAASQIQQLTDSRVTPEGRRAQVAAEANFPANGVGQTLLPSQARTAGKTAALRIVVVALVLGLLIGVAVAYVRSYRKRVFAHARDPELVLGVPLLVDASRRRSVDVFGRPRSPDNGAAVVAREHEMYAIAATLLVDQLFEKEETGHSLAVVAAHDGPTCSAVAWRSAAALASRGLRVLLIDADGSREPTEAWITTHAVERRTWTKERADGTFALSGADSSPGTAPSSTGVSAQVGSSKGSLSFCRGLPPARSSKILGEVFRELGDDSDVVLVNAPPFLASADAANLASAVEHVLIAVPDESSVTDHEELSRRLRLASAVPIGYIYCSREPDLAATTENAKIEQIDRNDSRIDRTVNALCKALFGADETTIVEKPQADEG